MTDREKLIAEVKYALSKYDRDRAFEIMAGAMTNTDLTRVKSSHMTKEDFKALGIETPDESYRRWHREG